MLRQIFAYVLGLPRLNLSQGMGMKRLVLIGLLVSGCVVSGSVNPYKPAATKEDVAAIGQALQRHDENIRLIAEKLAEIAPKPKEVAKK